MDIELVKQFTQDHLKGEKQDMTIMDNEQQTYYKMYLSDYLMRMQIAELLLLFRLVVTCTIQLMAPCDDPSKVIAEIKELLPKVGFTELEAQIFYL